ncbi:MAG: GNAT family N-acetyltransferase [Nitrososphaerales archaeon]
MGLDPCYPLRAERLALRPVTEADVDALVAYRSLPEVCRYVPFDPMGEDAVREQLGPFWARRSLDAAGQALGLAAELVECGTVVGDVMLHWSSEEHRSGEVGYVFHPGHAGRGYATEAVHRLVHLAFDDLGLHRVTARVDARNTRSLRLAGRLGMREEAHLRENEWFKGGWSDEIGFAILEEEWRAQHATGCRDLGAPVPAAVAALGDLASQELRDSQVEIYDRPGGVRLLYRHPVTGADH